MRNNRYNEAYEQENNGVEPCTDPSTAEIMAELNTREHVPNKVEAKKIRQERAKKGSRKNHKRS